MAKGGLRSVIRRVVSAEAPSGLADRLLLERFIGDRDESAFAALLERYGVMVLGVAWNVLGHLQDAEDVFQATFLVLARQANSVRKRGSLGSWLHGVAHRLALKARAAAAVRRRYETRAAMPMPVPGPVPAPVESADDLTWRELSAVLHEELERLPEKYRAPLVLCYLGGMTQDQAAERLGLAKGTLKGRLERARLLLRGRLGRRGLAPAVVLLADTYRPVGAALPAALVSTTVRSAVAFAAGQPVCISPRVVQLTEGALQTMFMTQLRSVTALLLVISLVAGVAGVGVLASQGGAGRLRAVPAQADRDKKPPAFSEPVKVADVKVDFEDVTISIQPGGLAVRQPESIRVRGDGICEYRIEGQPARGKQPAWPASYLKHRLAQERLRRLEAILQKTGWLAAGGKGILQLHAPTFTVTLKRKGKTQTVTLEGEQGEAYKSLVSFFYGITLQENLMYRLERLPPREQTEACQEIDRYVRAEKGGPYAKPLYEVDLGRYVATFQRYVRDPFTRSTDELAPAVRLLGHLRLESEREYLAALANDRDLSVRTAVAAALGTLGGKESLPVLRRMVRSTEEASWQLIRLGPLAVPTIVEIIESGKDPSNEREPDFLDYQHVIRAYLNHKKELPGPIDPRVLEAVRRSMAVPKIKAYPTRYHQELLDLAARLPPKPK
jgi:RNA polymerase sigma factor (sigma-70 family)